MTAETGPAPSNVAVAGAWLVRRKVLVLIMTGALLQLVLSGYYLAMVHAPEPRQLPVGVVAPDASIAQVRQVLDRGDSFSAIRYQSVEDMVDAIRAKTVYGGVDVQVAQPRLYLASAAGPAAANAMRATFASVLDQEVATQVEELTNAGQPVPPAVVRRLTTPAAVTDVVPLPRGDAAGTSLALLVQALVIGATVASTGLGKLGPMTQRSLRRGIEHVLVLLAYAAASAGAVLATADLFGVVPDRAGASTYAMCLLTSLAITGSVSGAVAIFGPAGAGLGTIYFLFGLIISGASVLPEFLPAFGRVFGQLLPTGAGAAAIRDGLYFPGASLARPVTVLTLYAGIGLLAVLITNAVPRQPRSAAADRTA